MVGSQCDHSGLLPHSHAVLQRTSVKAVMSVELQPQEKGDTPWPHVSSCHACSLLLSCFWDVRPPCLLITFTSVPNRQGKGTTESQCANQHLSVSWMSKDKQDDHALGPRGIFLTWLSCSLLMPSMSGRSQVSLPAKPISAWTARCMGPWLLPSLLNVQCKQLGFGWAPSCYSFHLYITYLCIYIHIETQQLEMHVFTF